MPLPKDIKIVSGSSSKAPQNRGRRAGKTTEQQTATERVSAYVDVYTARMAHPNSSYDGQVHSFGLADGEVKLTVQDIQTLLKLAKLSDAAIRAAEKRGAEEERVRVAEGVRTWIKARVYSWRGTDYQDRNRDKHILAEDLHDDIKNGEL